MVDSLRGCSNFDKMYNWKWLQNLISYRDYYDRIFFTIIETGIFGFVVILL